MQAVSGSGGTLNVALGSITRSGNGTFDLTLPNAGTVSASVPGNNNGVAVDASGNWADFITANGGSTWAGVSGSNLVAFNSYSVNSFGSSYQTHTDVTSNQAPSAFTVGDLRFNVDGVTLTLSGANDINAGGILVTPNASVSGVTITGGTLGGNGGGHKLTVFDYGKLTIASQINGTTTWASFTGPGITTLTGNNVYTGQTYINAGATLQIAGSSSASGATTIYAGGTLQTTGTGVLGGGTYSAVITNNGALVLGSSSNQTLSGIISGAGSVLQNGPGLVTLSAANIYTGGTTINGGTLAAAYGGSQTASSLPPGYPITVGAGATLQMNVNDALGYYAGNPSLITLNGGIVTSNGGSFHDTMPAFNLTAGTITAVGSGDGQNYVFDGTITTNASSSESLIATSGWIGLRNGQLNNGASNGSVTFNVARGSAPVDLLVASALEIEAGANGLIKAGNGMMVLTGGNTYTGGTTISGGTLQVGNGGASGTLGTTGGITNNAALVFSRSDSGLTISVVISGSGNVFQNGSGMVTLSGNNS